MQAVLSHLITLQTKVGPHTKKAGSRIQMLNQRTCPGKYKLNK